MHPSPDQVAAFQHALLHWHRHHNTRELPWKEERDPYKIWLSEILLQQTRAQQAAPYYAAFVAKYPTVKQLAAADDEEVFKLWQGLGYYSRCRNLLAAARKVSSDYGGIFPNTYEGLLKLPGVGAYTAAAVASFAFGLPEAVLDGNVYRVLARVFGIAVQPDSPEGKKSFTLLSRVLLPADQSAAYNQAIMDLGAVICLPKNPRCEDCPLARECIAFQTGQTATLPLPRKRTVVKERFFYYYLLKKDGKTWMQRRIEGDVWAGLYEPFLVEGGPGLNVRTLARQHFPENFKADADGGFLGALDQRLTHQLIHSTFYALEWDVATDPPGPGQWYDKSGIRKLPLPRSIALFFENSLYF